MLDLFVQKTFFIRIWESLLVLGDLWTIWVPVFLGSLFYTIWMKYVRTKFITGMNPVLLEVRVPKEVSKSPVAMEVFLNALVEKSSGTFTEVFIKGKTRPWFSLEIVSLGGNVKFFIWTPTSQRNLIEAQLYSQYPGVEIFEVPDYALPINYDPEVMTLNGAQLTLTKVDAYPIKTYIDYGLDKDPKEEFKIDPITPILEFLGSLKPQEQAWVQILVEAHKEEGAKEGRIFVKKEDWKKAAKTEIRKIIKESVFAPEEKSDEKVRLDYSKLSPAEKDTIMAIERSISKNAFNTMIRTVYFAPKDIYSSANNGGLIGCFRQYSSQTLNGFKKDWGPTYDYRWQDFKKKKEHKNKAKLLEAYKRRAFFHPPFKNFHGKPFILTVEEVATIFHLPGQVSTTPTFERVLSRKSEAPANLPV